MPSAQSCDVIVLGAGIAGLTAAHRLRDLDIQVVESEPHVGGRTYSEQLSESVWANFGAQYLLPDKARMVRTAQEVGAPLIEVPHIATHDLDQLLKDPSTAARLAESVKRLEVEQATTRDPRLAELDDISFAEWLGDRPRDELAAWEHWCQSSITSSSIEMSLYGALILWGKHRSGAFESDPVEFHELGECVVGGGTVKVAEGLASQLEGRVQLETEVLSLLSSNGEVQVVVRQNGDTQVMRARAVVSSLPAPIAANVMPNLPVWKRDLLRSVRYGRFVSTPIAVVPLGETREPYPRTKYRAAMSYNDNMFLHKTPGDLDAIGGCFHSYVYDTHARVVWDDSDESIKSGAVAALLDQRPELERRIQWVGIRRWRHGNPHYFPGRMKLLDGLREPVGPIHFCGDYTDMSNTEGALKSGERAATEVRRALEAR